MRLVDPKQSSGTDKFLGKSQLTFENEDGLMEIIHVSTRGQIVIPEGVRKRLHLTPGSRLILVERGSSLILKKEQDVARRVLEDERREELAWTRLAEKGMEDVWDNPKDKKVWRKYL